MDGLIDGRVDGMDGWMEMAKTNCDLFLKACHFCFFSSHLLTFCQFFNFSFYALRHIFSTFTPENPHSWFGPSQG